MVSTPYDGVRVSSITRGVKRYVTQCLDRRLITLKLL